MAIKDGTREMENPTSRIYIFSSGDSAGLQKSEVRALAQLGRECGK